MKRRLRISLLSSLALVLTVSAILQTLQPAQAATPGVYIALGDSIAAGIGSSLPRARGNAAIVTEWLTRLTGEIVPSENLAVPGETAATFIESGQLQRFRETVARTRAAGIPIAAVTLSLGGNELLELESTGLSDRQAGLDEFSIRYAEALSAVRSEIGPDTALVVTTYYDLSEGDATIQFSDAWWVEQFNAVIRQVAADEGARVAEVATQFRRWIDEYTLYPFDVHPSNAGHRAIAQSIWAALGFDSEPPTLGVTSGTDAQRSTATIRFSANDNVGILSVGTSSDDAPLRGPFETSENEYSVLLDLSTIDAGEVALTIEIGDDAGNVTREVVTIRVSDMRGDESN